MKKRKKFFSLSDFKRKNYLLLTLLFVFFSLLGCSPAQNDNTISNPASSTIGVLVGTTSERCAETFYPDAEILKFDSLSNAVTALQAKKVDYVISSLSNCINFARHNEDLTVLPDTLSTEGSSIAINKNETQLYDNISRLIEQYRLDGTLENLEKNWMRADGSGYVVEKIPEINDGDELKIAISAEREPICFVLNGEYHGMDVELARRLAYDMGMKPIFYDMKFSAMIPSVLSGKTPIAISNIANTPERRESVNFSPSYYINPQSLLTRKELVIYNTQPVPPEKAKIGSVTGTLCEDIALTKYPHAAYSSFLSLSDCMTALKSGKLDYVVLCKSNSMIYSRNDPCYKIYEEINEPLECNIAVNKDKTELLAKINVILDKYWADGTLDKVYSNWIREDGSDYIIEKIPELEDAPVLKVAVCSSFEPTSFILNGELMGYDVEIIKRIAYDIGMRVQFLDMNFDAIIASVQSKKADVALACMRATEERLLAVNFSDVYYLDSNVIIRYDITSSVNDKGFFESLIASFDKNFIRENRWKLIVSGIGITLLISVCSAIFGTVVGFGVCMMRRAHIGVFKGFSKAFIKILQGTPIVVLLMILYYVLLNKTGLDGVSVAIIAFGLNFGAYACEIFRTGIDAVDIGQWEAASAMGFNTRQTFQKIVFPQAAKHFLPVLKGEFISLVKMTSVVGYVAVQDLTKASDIIRSRTYEAFFPLIVTAIIYFLISWGLSSLLSIIEIRVDPKHRKRHAKVASSNEKKGVQA